MIRLMPASWWRKGVAVDGNAIRRWQPPPMTRHRLPINLGRGAMVATAVAGGQSSLKIWCGDQRVPAQVLAPVFWTQAADVLEAIHSYSRGRRRSHRRSDAAHTHDDHLLSGGDVIARPRAGLPGAGRAETVVPSGRFARTGLDLAEPATVDLWSS
ncbi:hypothetical protein [Nonomuraea antri]|uniref:hypothetical protein n=1 Tax=Nonomuraea antri TaxID=2730852 RepID=UPI0015692082|nr:hypothetical protein [Nonomuraea antri]